MTTTRHELIKKKIKKKFGTVSRFLDECETFSRWTVLHALQGRLKEQKRNFILDSIEHTIENIVPGPDPEKITEDQRELVRRVILIKFGSFTSFSKKNPEFTVPFLSNVVSGRKANVDDRFNQLIKKVNKYKSKIEIQ